MELTFCHHFKLLEKLGSGSFGEIFLAINLQDNTEVAIKLESLHSKRFQLEFEARLYEYLYKKDPNNYTGLPRVYNFGTEHEFNYMIMEKLGPSLEDLFNKCNKRFSMKTVIMIADQMIQRIQFLHSRRFIHRDIKPGNFLVGLGKEEHMIYISDLGLAKRYMIHGNHIPYKDNTDISGTTRYVSINMHLGIEQGRRDDLESLLYVLLYFLKGSLPWQYIKPNNDKDMDELIMEKKFNIPVETLCKGLPPEFETFLNYCRNLRFEDEPDYDYLRGLFSTLFKNSGYKWDYQYDWNENSSHVHEIIKSRHVKQKSFGSDFLLKGIHLENKCEGVIKEIQNLIQNSNDLSKQDSFELLRNHEDKIKFSPGPSPSKYQVINNIPEDNKETT